MKLNGARKAREMFSGGAGVGGAARLRGRVSAVPSFPLGGQRVVVTFTALALAAEYEWGGQQQEWRGHQEQEPKASKNAHDLGKEIQEQR